MSAVLHHIKHRVARLDDLDERLAWTKCGVRFCWRIKPDRDTEYHQPARERCQDCYGPN